MARPSTLERRPGERRARAVRGALISPAVLAVAIMGLFPLAFTVAAALTRSTLGRPFQEAVGAANLRAALAGSEVPEALARSVAYAMGVATVSVLLGIAIALALDASVRAGALVRTLLLLPLVTPPVVVGILWKLMLTPAGGLLDSLRRLLGIRGEPLSVLADPVWAPVGIALADIWEWTPLVVVLVFAALLGRDRAIGEAAALDGAHGGQLLWRITLPGIAGTLAAVFLVRLVLAFKVFDLVYVMTAGGPGQATTLPAYQIYVVALRNFDVGAAAAITLLLAIIVMLATLPVMALARRLEHG